MRGVCGCEQRYGVALGAGAGPARLGLALLQAA
jgi:hypothetical protein